MLTHASWRDGLVPLGIWAVFTVLGAVILSVAAARQIAIEHTVPGYTVTAPMPASPGYFGVVTNWDGNWYRSISEHGYPTVLPVDDHGNVQQNEWAFYPLYPLLVRGVMTVTGVGFAHGAWAVSLVFGAAAMVALYNLVRAGMGRFGAAALVSCVMAYMSAPVLQVAYTEGLALFLIVAFMAALTRRRLDVAIGVAILVSLARPVAAPLGLVMGGVLLLDWLQERRERPAHRLPVKGVAATVAVFATAGIWPLIAWATTGSRDAFFQTQAAWPVNSNGLGGWLGDVIHVTPIGLLAIAVVGFLALVNARPRAHLWGRELQLWSIAYPVFLIVASRPSPSAIRYFMLAVAPLWPFPGLSLRRTRGSRAAAIALLIALIATGLGAQYLWTTHVFTVPGTPSQQFFP